jgi:formylglycine-generating enzyme required for sulfatase activity
MSVLEGGISMADIFISYSKQEPEPTRKLAAELEGRGYTVWWDTSLLAGDDFRRIIVKELNAAKAVIVIWTPASVHSNFVIEEAQRGQTARKLIPLRVPAVEIDDIPLGFGTLHTVMVDDVEHVVNALAALGVYRAIGCIKVDAKIIHGAPDGWFKPGAGKSEWFKDHEHGPEMVVVPAGSFMMGSPANELERQPGEGPLHKVTIAQPFAVSRHAISRGQFAAFVKNTNYETEGGALVWTGTEPKLDPNASWRNPGFRQSNSHPVVCINWDDANAYALWLSDQSRKIYRLLTEAEWEYVARAGSATPFWWGVSITPEQANYGGERKATVPVGNFEVNPWGLFNVHGNVWEWCKDFWHENYDGALADGSAWLEGRDSRRRVARGGSWFEDHASLRSAVRGRFAAALRFNGRGFRLARTLY